MLTGISGLDHLLGGGLPLGTVTLFSDIPHSDLERGQSYSLLLAQYFLAEGCFHRHKIFHGHVKPNQLQLPAIIGSNSEDTSKSKNDDKELQIAWRYKDQAPKSDELTGTVKNHHFNLNKVMPNETYSDLLTSWHFDLTLTDASKSENHYAKLFKSISDAAKAFEIDPKKPATNMLRINLTEIGGIVFGQELESLLFFLYRLRALARSHLIVIALCLSSDFLSVNEIGSSKHQKVLELVDFGIDVTAFGKSERESGLFKDHHGIIEISKAAPLNCLQNQSNVNNVKTKHLFKSLRTKFSISPMHLPPDSDVSQATDSIKSLEF